MNSIQSSPHVKTSRSVTQVMLAVVYAMIPGVLVYIHFFGWGLLVNIIIALLTAWITEAVMLQLRGRPVIPFLMDGSATVTALLLAIALPSLSPWWLTVIGVSFAIIIAKHLYGGLGYNPFNPAMVGYATLLIAFPLEMTQWLPAGNNTGFIESLNYALFGQLHVPLDAITSASPLDAVKTQLTQNLTLGEIASQSTTVFGAIGGYGWEWVNVMFMLGGIVLIFMRIINWHIPVAMLGSLFVFSAIFSMYDADAFASPWFHLFSGATMLGAFFIATDPVTAATTVKGRIIFGAGIGFILFVIRTWGGYPDAIAFAVLLMNMAVPTIDYYTQPRVFGQNKNQDGNS